MDKAAAPQLSGIPETMLITLWAKAAESDRPDPIFQDPKTKEIISRIDYDFERFRGGWMVQVGVAVRSSLFDTAVRDFLSPGRKAVVINLGAGLDTRFERLKCDGLERWYDLDVPEAIEVRRRYFKENDRNRFISKSVFDYSWLDEIEDNGAPVLIIAEGMLMYFKEEEIRSLFRRLRGRFREAEMYFEVLSPFMAGKGRHHVSLKKMDSKVDFRWGLKDSRTIESWADGLEYVKEWNYYDYYRSRWRWFWYLARIPLIRANMSSRIVHVRFQ